METLREESAGPLEVLPSLPEDALQVRVARCRSRRAWQRRRVAAVR